MILKAHFFGIIRDPASSNYQRLDCLRQLGVNVKAHDTGIFNRRPGFYHRVKQKLTHTVFSGDEVTSYNEGVLKACLGAAPDLVWFEWPLQMERQTLMHIRELWPRSMIICYQDDNPFNGCKKHRPRWGKFIDNIPLYDLHLVKRPSDVFSFREAGAKRVEIFTTGYFQNHFQLNKLSESGPPIRHDVSFLGTAIDGRGALMARLLRTEGLDVHIYGARWNRTLIYYLKRHHFHGFLPEKRRLALFNGSRINLGFVSTSNHDEYTGRSFEIPASGGFLLAMRTPTHSSLFCEGVEAEFFSSAEECADKIKFYLKNEEARQRIARSGYERCIRSDYRLVSRMRECLAQLFPSAELAAPRKISADATGNSQ